MRCEVRKFQPVVQIGHHGSPHLLVEDVGVGQRQHLLLHVAGNGCRVHVHTTIDLDDTQQGLRSRPRCRAGRCVVDTAADRYRLVDDAVIAVTRERHHQIPAVTGLEHRFCGRLHVGHGQAVGSNPVMGEWCTGTVVVDEVLQPAPAEIADFAGRHVVQHGRTEFQVDRFPYSTVNDAPPFHASCHRTHEARHGRAIDGGVTTTVEPAVGAEIIDIFHTGSLAIITGVGLTVPDLLRGTIGRCSPLDLAIGTTAGVLDLLQHHHTLLHLGVAGGTQQGIEIPVALGRGLTVTPDDQRTRHAAGHLQRRRTVEMGVIPEGSRRMVRGNIDFVFQGMSRCDGLKDVIAGYARVIPAGVDPQTMRMQVGGIWAVKTIRDGVIAFCRIFRRQIVVQRDVHPRSGHHIDGRRNERGIVTGIVAAQVHPVILAGGGVPQVRIHITHVQGHGLGPRRLDGGILRGCRGYLVLCTGLTLHGGGAGCCSIRRGTLQHRRILDGFIGSGFLGLGRHGNHSEQRCGNGQRHRTHTASRKSGGQTTGHRLTAGMMGNGLGHDRFSA